MTPSNMKEGAYSFLKQYPTSAVECILVHLSVGCGIMSLQFNLTASKKKNSWIHMDQSYEKEILNSHEPSLYQWQPYISSRLKIISSREPAVLCILYTCIPSNRSIGPELTNRIYSQMQNLLVSLHIVLLRADFLNVLWSMDLCLIDSYSATIA
jgi:hypothetical protein